MDSYRPNTIITAAEQVHAWDRLTQDTQRISSLELMQRAVRAFVDQFVRDYPLPTYERVDVLCGPGNNGGDGAGIAAELAGRGYTVVAYGIHSRGTSLSADLNAMWTLLKRSGNVAIVDYADYDPPVEPDVVIDGVFGVGVSRPAVGAFAKTIARVNDVTEVPTVSIDVPSGQAISGQHPDWPCIRAASTYTFGAIKYSALLPDTGRAWGRTRVVDIGLADPRALPGFDESRRAELITQAGLGALLAPRPHFSHKGTWGHVLVLSGSRGHGGAALLAGRGAYRGGAGLVTFCVPGCLEQLTQTGLPEAMAITDAHDEHLTQVPDLGPYDAVVVGPGLGQAPATAAMLDELFERAGERPIVIDADALNLIAASPSLSAKLPSNAVLTPHPGEFARLVGKAGRGHERLTQLLDYVASLSRPAAVVVLKDTYTAVATTDLPLAINYYHGNPGMGTGGMGDVLSGVIGAQLARGLSTYDAARVGVYLHAAAGDLAAARVGERGLLAGDLVDCLGWV